MLSGGYIRGVDWTAELDGLTGMRFLVTHGRKDQVLSFEPAMEIAVSGGSARALGFV